MPKRFNQLSAVFVAITVLILVCVQSFASKPGLLEKAALSSSDHPTLVATAATPPTLQRAILGGKPVYVLYVTRDEDRVLIRCYPGYEPTIAVRTMGSNPNANAPKEGVMTCKSAT